MNISWALWSYRRSRKVYFIVFTIVFSSGTLLWWPWWRCQTIILIFGPPQKDSSTPGVPSGSMTIGRLSGQRSRRSPSPLREEWLNSSTYHRLISELLQQHCDNHFREPALCEDFDSQWTHWNSSNLDSYVADLQNVFNALYQTDNIVTVPTQALRNRLPNWTPFIV